MIACDLDGNIGHDGKKCRARIHVAYTLVRKCYIYLHAIVLYSDNLVFGRRRQKPGERAVDLNSCKKRELPFLLLYCELSLWFFSLKLCFLSEIKMVYI
jgi:hypothetical protein